MGQNRDQRKFHSGFISIVGRPNVGKSTLMNALVGEKIAIISNKPQTTRNKITSILTRESFQAVFMDTPGLHAPKSKLGEYMVRSAAGAMNDVDVLLYVVEPFDRINENDAAIIARLKKAESAAVILVINKLDTVDKPQLLKVMDSYRAAYDFKEMIPISASKGENLDMLLDIICEYLPLGPKYFPEDMVTDQPERQLAAEMIREKALYLLQEEIPHGIAVDIIGMKKREGQDLVDVDATIYCEKNSHKGMIIGKQGTMLKEIGKRARQDMERLLGSKIYLQLWVSVKKDWRDSELLLRNFGYDSRQS